MRRNVRKTTGYKDPQIDALAGDCSRAFDAVFDFSVHTVTITWNPPFPLLVPFFGGENRLSSPKIVRCERAVDVSGETLATPGSSPAWRWIGNGQVEIQDVSGLVVGTRYELTFSVVG